MVSNYKNQMAFIEHDLIDLHMVEKYYPNLFETVMETFPQLSYDEKEQIASLILGVCSFCHDNKNSGCYCMRDE